ncbi:MULTISPECIES: ribosome silencing factor [Paenibacillus]|uniref:Ribosomal silencing factor RsfS n=1 Tax=Paenibacillus vini TaxID=1476024 RepID=A0ABQ4MHE1_9BACL|nr:MULTISPECIES: ribosome silencing factor [Paenibacillus]MBQ4897653.1 ribosome silencing factor [Paenibacillus sp. Marseille-P2973]MDN4070114.1 ribosome silencing factor [Paenibacillus vini]GIP55413.1 ribosomal silencing factor RsfS [Paenibacillus vini]
MPVSPTELLSIAVAAAEDKKAMNLVALDLKGISLIADYFVICHGNSDTQVQAIATEVRKRTQEAGVQIRGIEGMNSARWVLMDLGDVVVHIFHRDEREYYNIERLWSDAKVVENV